jgi:threonine 3-dehydrogenase
VTGGTGFIGAQVVRLLLVRGESQPLIFDLNPAMNRLDGIAERVEVVRGDLGNFSHVLDTVKRSRPQVIYHLGGMLSVPSEADPPAALRANALGTFHVLEAARLFGVAQVVFSSTIGTYGLGIEGDTLTDTTIQRPVLFYGVTKVFGEHCGLFYRRKYRLDFRALRYPTIVGPGVRTPGVAQYASWVIEESARGNPFTVWVPPETRLPVMYFKDAARAIVELADAPRGQIKTVSYLVAGATPNASAGELADIIRAKIPGAQIDFRPDPELAAFVGRASRPVDDSNARREWGWDPEYDQERTVDDFLEELREHPQRYG